LIQADNTVLEEESFDCLNKIQHLDKIVQGKGFEPMITGYIPSKG
jgi:hypothetical protein